MQTYVVIASGRILNVSTVHLNGIWHFIWRYLSKPALGGHPVLSGHYSIPRGCPVKAGFTVFVCFSFFFQWIQIFIISSWSFLGILRGERTGLICYRLKLRGTFNISSLDKDQLANIHGHFWKERLKLKKLIKF